MTEINAFITPYLIAAVGFLIVYVLSGIKGEIRDVRKAVNCLESDLRGGLSSMDRRLTAVETRCQMEHESK